MVKKTQKQFQQEITESAHKIWLAGLGALSAAEDEGSKLFKTLIEKGESFEARSKKSINKVKSKVEDAVDQAESTLGKIGDTFDDKVAGAVKRLGVPSRNEIQKLTKRVEELTIKVDQLKPKPRPKAVAKPKPATTTKARKTA